MVCTRTGCVWLIHIFSWHHLQIGLSVNPILIKKCSFRRQRPVSNPITHCNWFLFEFSSSLVLLAVFLYESFGRLSPVKESHF
jgi:hypothetical protein